MTVAGIRRAGERAVVLDVDGNPPGVAGQVRRLAQTAGTTLVDVVPGARTVLVVATDPAQLARFLAALPQLEFADDQPDEDPAAAVVELAVRYNGPDLTAVAEATGMDVADVVRRHCAATYRAAFTGFAPGFAYLTGLDRRLHLPRRDSPRPAVPPGAVAIADTYSAVYPRASPGGWHLLGSTDAPIFDPDRASPALISPGTYVRFVAESAALP
jgi:KipI family sensor histidine kinase inhibitor